MTTKHRKPFKLVRVWIECDCGLYDDGRSEDAARLRSALAEHRRKCADSARFHRTVSTVWLLEDTP